MQSPLPGFICEISGLLKGCPTGYSKKVSNSDSISDDLAKALMKSSPSLHLGTGWNMPLLEKSEKKTPETDVPCAGASSLLSATMSPIPVSVTHYSLPLHFCLHDTKIQLM